MSFFDLYRNVVENDEWNIAAVSEVDIDMINSGTDTTTTRYLNLGSPALGILLSASEDISITKINGRLLKNPITLATGTTFVIKDRLQFRSLQVSTSATNTIVRILVTG